MYQQASRPTFDVIGGHWSVCIVGGQCACWNGKGRLYTGLVPGEPHQQNLNWLSSTALWYYGVLKNSWDQLGADTSRGPGLSDN